VIVDGDVDVFPSDALVATARRVGVGRVVVLLRQIAPAFAGAAFDPAELLDVDVHELARSRAFVALGRLETEPTEAAHP
jgi:hypothetical protein